MWTGVTSMIVQNLALSVALLSVSWLAMFSWTYKLYTYFREDDDPFAPFSNPLTKRVVVPILILWNYSYGILFMVVYCFPDAITPHAEQLWVSVLDVCIKLFHTGLLLSWNGARIANHDAIRDRATAGRLSVLSEFLDIMVQSSIRIGRDGKVHTSSGLRSTFG